MLSLPILPLLLLLAWPVVSVSAEDSPSAQEIVAQYLEAPCPEKLMGAKRSDRTSMLRLLQNRPDEGTEAIAAVLAGVGCDVHKLELLEVLGRMPSRASADLLILYLDDPALSVRRQALMGLRLHASRIRRAGVVNVPRGPEFPAAVDGLVPHLVSAAHDDSTGIRWLALWALADSRDAVAVAALRSALEDPEPSVCLTAACLLTEFDDDSGLPVLREALNRWIQARGDTQGISTSPHFMEAQHLLVSFERITGESLGGIPPNPMILSSLNAQEQSRRDYDALLRRWDAWWRQHENGR